MRQTHLALWMALLLVDVTLQSDKRKRQSAPCPEGWVRPVALESCYLFGRLSVRWLEAVGICQARGAKLLEPKSELQMNVIADEMRLNATGAVWTGGSKMFKEKRWRWFDGNTVIGPYTAWSPLSPNNTGGKDYCIEIHPDSGYLWNDIDCYTNNKFVCELRLS